MENQYAGNPDDGFAAMELGRLYTITSLGKRGFKVLKKAKQLDPQNPEPYKYLAILHVDMMCSGEITWLTCIMKSSGIKKRPSNGKKRCSSILKTAMPPVNGSGPMPGYMTAHQSWIPGGLITRSGHCQPSGKQFQSFPMTIGALNG